MRVRKLIQEANNSSISFGEYIQRLHKNMFLYTDELKNEITFVRSKKDTFYLEDLIAIASIDGVDNRLTIILCELLKEHWHQRHEDIVMLLDAIKDNSSVDILYETALNIPDYDEGRSLAKKCIWALGSINTLEAKINLKLLCDVNDPIIKEAATKELIRLGNPK